ncbi:protein of unknown function [Paraburkholderia dioscoreae]|uniref:Uncharacterized protein n=1 Tax=Paraburkholderia dioscoreae TaxID=2604047 RepID=A0A5Q4ZAK9_9BURK|nr:protein of unknown function [Paraburkholderia dioscoreae]
MMRLRVLVVFIFCEVIKMKDQEILEAQPPSHKQYPALTLWRMSASRKARRQR